MPLEAQVLELIFDDFALLITWKIFRRHYDIVSLKRIDEQLFDLLRVIHDGLIDHDWLLVLHFIREERQSISFVEFTDLHLESCLLLTIVRVNLG